MEAEESDLGIVLFLLLERKAGFVWLQGSQSVEKQEASRPAHPHGQLVPSDSWSPLPVSYSTYNGSHPHSGTWKPAQPEALCRLFSQPCF